MRGYIVASNAPTNKGKVLYLEGPLWILEATKVSYSSSVTPRLLVLSGALYKEGAATGPAAGQAALTFESIVLECQWWVEMLFGDSVRTLYVNHRSGL